MLPRYNTDLNLKVVTGQTPLALAVELGQAETVERLLQRQVDPNVELGETGTVLHPATRRRDCVIVDMLVEKGVDLNIKDGKGNTALLVALKAEAAMHDPANERIVERLLDSRVGPLQRDGHSTAGVLHAAIRSGNTHIISTILDSRYGTNVNPPVDELAPESPLALAVRLGQLPSVELLLKKRCKPGFEIQGGGCRLWQRAEPCHEKTRYRRG